MSARQRKSSQKSKKAGAVKVAPVPFGSHFGVWLRKHWKWVLGALVLVHVALALLVLEPAPHTGGDNAGYLTLARSLLEHHNYRDYYDPRAPLHTQYPPVFPLILAIAITLGMKPWLDFKLLTIAFSAVAVAFSFLWIRRHGRPELAVGVATVLTLAPGVLNQSHWELSDVPFWAFTMLAIWAWQRLPQGMRLRFFVAVIATTLAYFTRSAGLPLLIAAGGWLAWRRRWSQLAVFAAVIVPLAFLWWLRAKSQGGVDYVSQFWSLDPYNPALGRMHFADLFARMKDNGAHYLTRHLPVLLFGTEGLLPVSIVIVALGVYGWAMRLKHASISELFLPLYIGLLLVWPAVWSGERFLLPALPFILFYAGDALVRLTRIASRNAVRVSGAVALALLIILGVPATGQAVHVGMECVGLYRAGDEYACLPDQYKDYYHVAEIAPRILPRGSVVLSRKARSFYVISGLPGHQVPLSNDPQEFFKLVDQTHARYVVFDYLDAVSQVYLAPVLLKNPDAFCVMFGLGEERPVLFGINRAAALTGVQSRRPGDWANCDASYWRSAAVRDSLQHGLISVR